MPDVQPSTSLAEELGGIAGPVVGHDALHGHAQALIVTDGRLEEGDRAAGDVVRHHTDEADPGMVINGDMQIFPSRSRGVDRFRVPPGHPMPGFRKAPQCFDVDVNDLARCLASVADNGRTVFEILHPAQFQKPKMVAQVDAEIPRSAGIRFPLHRWSRRAAIPAKDVLRDTAVQPVGAGRAVLKAISPLGPETCDPLMGSRLGDSEGGGSISHGRPFLEHAAHQHGSTMRRRSRILMSIHSALLGAGLL